MSLFQKIKKINFLVSMIELILIFVFIFSIYKIVSYVNEGKKEHDFHGELADSAVSDINPEDEYDFSKEAIDKISPFEGYDPSSNVLIYPDIKVDMEKVKEKYPNAVGWLYSPDTPINYPVMQGKDNAYFVNRLPNGAENAAGSIFMDYRDNAALTDFSHVLYGHNMKNNSMFGTILDYRKEGYFQKHPFMFYFTEEKTYRLEIFAGVNTLATSNLYLEPDKPEDFILSVFSKSTFSSNVSVSSEDRIFLMSTCSGAVGQNNRYVLFAKVIEI